jgi:hypothetical protein
MFHYLATGGLWQFIRCPIFPQEPNPHRGILHESPFVNISGVRLSQREIYLWAQIVAYGFSDLIAGYYTVWLPHYPNPHNFAVVGIWNGNGRSFEYGRMAGHDILNLDGE